MDPAPLLQRLLRAAARGPDAVLAELEAPLRAAGLAPRRTRAAPHAVLWSRGRPRLALSGHVDVVPVGEGWQRDAFGGEVGEGRVWGRGACDMLGSVACFVAAAERTKAASTPCAILLTTDEETTMLAAQHALAEGLLAGIEGIVVGEPTDMQVGVAEKGVLWTRLTTRGKNAHGSMPHLGVNAAERMVRILAEVQRVKLSGEHALLGPATINLGRMAAGEAVNQVPASATADLDIRYLPGTVSADVVALLRQATPEAFEIEFLSDHAPFEIDPDAPLAKAAPGQKVGLPYGTEASKYAPAGIPCIILGPGEPGLAHTNKESIALDALAKGSAVYVQLLESFR